MDYCTSDDSQASCSLELGKLGTMNSYSYLDVCVDPPEMDMNLELNNHGRWEFRFVSGNQAESRSLGPRIWPLKLHVDFSNPAVLSRGHSTVKACLESLKTGQVSCFLNHTFAIPQCSAQSGFLPTFSWPLILSLVLLLTVLISMLTLAFICCRRVSQSKYSRHLDESSSCRSSSHGSDELGKDAEDGFMDPPLLPMAKPYPLEDLPSPGGKTRKHYKQYNVHFADEIDCFVGSRDKYFFADSPNSADSGLSTFSGKSEQKKSKEIQTSTTSLDGGYSSPPNPILPHVTVIS